MFKHRVSMVVGLLMVSAAVSRAVAPPREVRERVVVKIMAPQLGDERVGGLPHLLEAALRRDRFTVEVLSGEPLPPREYLAKNPSVDHVIAEILADENGRLLANVYMQGFVSPEPFQCASQEALTAQVLAYLEDEETVWKRIEMRPYLDDLSAGDPNTRFDAHIRLGLYHMLKTEKLDEAIAAFEAAVEIRRDPVPYVNLALCYERKRDYEKCRECVESGLVIDSRNLDLRNHKAVLLMRQGRLPEAIEILKALRDDNLIVQWNLAYAYWQSQEPQKAKAHLQRILALDRTSPMATIAGDRLGELERKERALTKTKQALWFAVGGLLCVGTIALIIIVWRRTSRGIAGARELKPADVFALKVQIGIALLSGLFGILPLVLGRVLGG